MTTEPRTTHTPGPWEHLWTNKVVHVVPHKRDVERYENIATVLVPDGGHGVKTANARLIAAAPDLLKAAKLAQAYMETCDGKFARSVDEDLKEAIAKAEASHV